MTRAEKIMLSYFDSKESYVAFKLAHHVVVEKNVNGLKNSSMSVRNSDGYLRSFDGKPANIDVGKRAYDVNGIYSISWDDGTEDFRGSSRDKSEGPGRIYACKNYDGERLLLFTYFDAGRRVEIHQEEFEGRALFDREQHRRVHEIATGIAYNKFLFGCV